APTVLVAFSGSWCPPCRAEMPVLDNLAQTHKTAGLVVLGLNVDVDNESRDEYLKEHPVSFPILDDSKWSTAKLYIAPSQPVTFFVDRDGNLAHVHQGYKSGDDLVYATKVIELLAK
ncbi:MAG TPA: TlpA disulfide reductase family protein, partial [Marinagarivorans sp.]|nr:TlpA disulfide reductase family protein [Marinagarivorans sp.]